MRQALRFQMNCRCILAVMTCACRNGCDEAPFNYVWQEDHFGHHWRISQLIRAYIRPMWKPYFGADCAQHPENLISWDIKPRPGRPRLDEEVAVVKKATCLVCGEKGHYANARHSRCKRQDIVRWSKALLLNTMRVTPEVLQRLRKLYTNYRLTVYILGDKSRDRNHR